MNLRVFRKFAALLPQSPAILDAGCGDKPFRSLLSDVRYIGSDFSPQTGADLLADNARLPFRDSSFDGVIASETLEHTLDFEHAAGEIARVCQPGALLFVTVPFHYPIHNPPIDFQRLTSYRLAGLFKDHEIILLEAANSIFSSWLITLGYGITYASYFFPYSAALTFVPQVFLNLLAVGIEGAAAGAWKLLEALGLGDKLRRRALRKGLGGFWSAMPAGYAMVVRIRKN